MTARLQPAPARRAPRVPHVPLPLIPVAPVAGERRSRWAHSSPWTWVSETFASKGSPGCWGFADLHSQSSSSHPETHSPAICSAAAEHQRASSATLAGSLTSAAQVESISQYACRSLLACPSHKASDLTLEGHCQTELHKSHGMGSALPFFATGFPLRKPQT